jgi:STAS domain
MSVSPPDTINLDGSYQLHQLAPLKAKVMEALKPGAVVEIATGHLTEVSPALLQMFHAAHKQAALTGCQLAIQCPDSGLIASALEASGLMNARPERPLIDGDRWLGLAAH